jgi:hypothetical protein
MFHEVSPVRGISAWWIVDPRRLLLDPAWAIFLFNVCCGDCDWVVQSRLTRSGGMVRFGTSLFYVRQMTVK